MENPTQFDLNENLGQWRKHLESPALREQDLEELECHLRDSIAKWEGSGLSTEEAFWIATRRIGSGDTLACEFGKAHPERVWLTRAVWVVAGWLMIQAVLSTANTVSMLISIGLQILKGGYDLALFQWIGAHLVSIRLIVYWLALAGMGLWIWRSCRFTNRFVPRLSRWMQAHPVVGAISVAALLLGNSTASFGAAFLAAKVMPLDIYGSFSMWSQCAGLLTSISVPCFVLGWLLARSSRCLKAE